MIKIEIKDNLKIEVDLSIKESIELANALIKNKDDMEVKMLITHLSTILECYKKATISIPSGGTSNKKSAPGRTLSDLLRN